MFESQGSSMTRRLFLLLSLALLGHLLIKVLYSIHSLFKGPLAKFPGPKLWALSRLPYVKSLWTGRLAHDVEDLHSEYGDAIRVGPNEISFASINAWDDVFGWRQGRALNKTKVWHSSQPGRPLTVINALDNQQHARMRKAMQPGFTEKALANQEPIVQRYATLLAEKLSERIDRLSTDSWLEIDVVQWVNFTTVDIIGDLGFGESFDCLKTGEYHQWVSIVNSFFKSLVIGGSLRFFPRISWLLNLYVPKPLKEAQRTLNDISTDKLTRRLNLEKSRPDLIGYTRLKEDGDGNGEGLSLPELFSTADILIAAGSETTATVLTGIIDYLLRDSLDPLQCLTNEVREAFPKESDMTFSALKNLPYLTAVIHEGLRLCHPTPSGAFREIPQGGAAVCGHWLPEGTLVNVHPRALSRSPKHFHQPERFAPERWLESAQSDPMSPFYNDNRKAVQGFGVGPRNCIGKSLAWQELRLVLARLLWTFDLSKAQSEQTKWEDRKTYILVEKGSLYINIKKRNELKTAL